MPALDGEVVMSTQTNKHFFIYNTFVKYLGTPTHQLLLTQGKHTWCLVKLVNVAVNSVGIEE